MEIERKYLVRELPSNLESYPHVEIEQGYLCTSPTVRIRRMGDAHILTIKEKVVSGKWKAESGKPAAIENREEEFTLSSDAYARLKSKCEGRMVLKTRYRIPIPSLQGGVPAGRGGGLTAELDLFHGYHEGMRLVEVEFPSVEAANAFTPPAWFGEDISDDRRYRNSYLAFNV